MRQRNVKDTDARVVSFWVLDTSPIDRDDPVVHQYTVAPINMTVPLGIDGQQAVLNPSIRITARHKSEILWAKDLARWNAGPVTVCYYDTVFPNSGFNSSEKQIIGLAARNK